MVARRITNDVISAIEDGFLDWEIVAGACLKYMSEDEVADMVRLEGWAIADDETFDEEEEEDEEVDSLSEETLDKIWKIAERYNTSSPVSGNWDTEIIHERDAIVKEVGLTKKEANEVMVEYLGFDTLDIEIAERKFGEKVSNESLITEEVCPDCGKEVGKDGYCYNQECVAYDPIAQYFEDDVESNDVVYYCFDFNDDIIDEFTDQDDAIDFAESDLGITRVVRYVGDNLDEEVWRRDDEEVLAEAINTSESEDELVGDDYRKIDFYREGVLVGDIELLVEDVEVLDRFDNDINIDYTYTARVTPDTVIEFICNENDVKKEDLTVSQAQKFIDRLVMNLTSYYDMLIEFYYDEIQDEAQQYIMEN